VEVEWDPIPDAEGYEDITVSNQKLLPSKWRRDKEGAWRMDVDIDIESDLDSESNDEDENDEDVVSDSDDSSNQ